MSLVFIWRVKRGTHVVIPCVAGRFLEPRRVGCGAGRAAVVIPCVAGRFLERMMRTTRTP